MLNTRSKKLGCHTTRFFWEKVEGKQFHPTYSGCDVFSVRLQIRKDKNCSWEAVSKILNGADWGDVIFDKYTCTKSKTRLVTSFRISKPGNHKECTLNSFFYHQAMRKAKKQGLSEVSYKRPIHCRLEKNNNV